MPGDKSYLSLLLLMVTHLCQSKNFHSRMQQVLQQGSRKEHFQLLQSSMLPDSKEITAYLLKNVPKRYYFMVEDDLTPVSVTVTPCDIPIEWSLAFQKPSEKSLGTGYDKYKYLKTHKSHTTMEPMVTIFKYKGNDVETYVSNSPHTTLHRLELMSTEKDTSIKIYMTKHPKPGQLYPELPNDPRINIIGIGHTTVTVAWQPSPSALQYNSDIQYCLLINVKHNYKSLCAAEATLSTRVRMNDNKALSLFITTDLLKQSELILHSKVNNRMTSHAIHKESSWDVRHICIGTNTIYTIHSLLPNTQYYIDVFAINLLTNASAAYTGTFSKTLEEPIPSAKPLKDGEVALVNISGKGYQLYSFQSQGPNRRVQFTIQACAGDVWVQITRNGRRLVSEMVEDLRYFTLKGKPADTYIVHLQSMGTSRASTKVHVTSHFYRPLFPILPESLKIKSFNKLRTCDSITIAWLGTQERAKYCVYRKRLEKGHATKEIMNKDICSEPEARKKSEKVRCKTFHNLNLQRAVTTETIRGLESGTPYLFDVYLVGPTGIPIKYKSKVVSTRKEC